ncbi:hypothetical protein D3C87_1565240 [compost metagenome]
MNACPRNQVESAQWLTHFGHLYVITDQSASDDITDNHAVLPHTDHLVSVNRQVYRGIPGQAVSRYWCALYQQFETFVSYLSNIL